MAVRGQSLRLAEVALSTVAACRALNKQTLADFAERQTAAI
jgi:hypothetical protein